jgi:hypothetical protein
MDSSVSPKDEMWFLRVYHHISKAVYNIQMTLYGNGCYMAAVGRDHVSSAPDVVVTGQPDEPFLFLFLFKALQLRRSFGLPNQFFPSGTVFDAVLPICYFHICYVAFYIILPPIFRSS